MGPLSRHSAEVYFLDLMEKRERLESRRSAAEALGVHPQHLYNIEKRRSGVSLSLALRVVRRYGPLHLLWARDGSVFLLQEVGRGPVDTDPDSPCTQSSRSAPPLRKPRRLADDD